MIDSLELVLVFTGLGVEKEKRQGQDRLHVIFSGLSRNDEAEMKMFIFWVSEIEWKI